MEANDHMAILALCVLEMLISLLNFQSEFSCMEAEPKK